MARALTTLCLVFAAIFMAAVVWAAPPYVPSDPIPADGATGVGMRPRLEWTGGDPEDDPVKYYITIVGSGQVCPEAQTLWNLKRKRTRKRIPRRRPLPPDTDFYWVVGPVDSNNESPPPEDLVMWQFSTGSYPFICRISPRVARPTYVMDIYGVNFGDEPGQVKIGKEWIWAGWGKILYWSDEHITLVLPDHRCWGSSLPGTFKVRVWTAAGRSNFKKIFIEYGGGGTTW